MMRLVFVLILLKSHLLIAEKTITVANSPWEPYYGKNLPGWGASAEIFKESFNIMGFNVTFRQMKWARGLIEVKKGRKHCLITAYYTEDRAKHYHFTDSYMDSEVVLFKKKTAPNVDWKTLEDLKDKIFIVVAKNSYGDQFDKATYLKKSTTIDETMSLTRLYIRNSGDYVVMDRLVGAWLIKNKLPKYQNAWDTIKKPISKNRLYVMCSKKIKGMEDYVEKFNQGLKKIIANGTKGKILEKYGFPSTDL